MAGECPECKVELTDAQVSLAFRAVHTGSDEWPEFPVLASICPKCGKMEFRLATPGNFNLWLDSENAKARVALVANASVSVLS